MTEADNNFSISMPCEECAKTQWGNKCKKCGKIQCCIVSHVSEKDAVLKINSPKKQKFEEIKNLAEKLLAMSVSFNQKEMEFKTATFEGCWEIAKLFCEFVEQKEKEMIE